MEYQPKILKNDSDHKVEFRCGGAIYIFEPGEKRLLNGFVAYHALNHAKAGLTDVTSGEIQVPTKPNPTVAAGVSTPQTGPEVVPQNGKIDYRQLKWKELVQAVKCKGYTVGMNREQIYALLEGNYEEPREGTD